MKIQAGKILAYPPSKTEVKRINSTFGTKKKKIEKKIVSKLSEKSKPKFFILIMNNVTGQCASCSYVKPCPRGT